MKTIAMVLTLTGAVALSTSAFAGGSGGCSQGAYSKWHGEKSSSELADSATNSSESATRKQ